MIQLKSLHYAESVPRIYALKYYWKMFAHQVYAVASEDMDTLAFGATRFIRHLMDPRSKKTPVVEFEILKVL